MCKSPSMTNSEKEDTRTFLASVRRSGGPGENLGGLLPWIPRTRRSGVPYGRFDGASVEPGRRSRFVLQYMGLWEGVEGCPFMVPISDTVDPEVVRSRQWTGYRPPTGVLNGPRYRCQGFETCTGPVKDNKTLRDWTLIVPQPPTDPVRYGSLASPFPSGLSHTLDAPW